MNRACFPEEKHQNSQKWAKFMNFSFWPFLWFGLPGRLLKIPNFPRFPHFRAADFRLTSNSILLVERLEREDQHYPRFPRFSPGATRIARCGQSDRPYLES